MVQPIRFSVGQYVRLTTAAYQRAVDSNRSSVTAGNPSLDFLAQLKNYVGARGTVTHEFPPGYEVTVKFHDGRSFHMKDSWIEPDVPSMTHVIFVVINPHNQEATSWFRGYDAKQSACRSRTLGMREDWGADALTMGLQDLHQLTIGAGPNIMRRYILREEPYAWTDPVTKQTFPMYAIVYPAFIDQSAVSRGGSLYNWFRVVNLWTGAQSSLYSLQECERIIMLALTQGLKGSFN